MLNKDIDLSIIIPCLNEKDNILSLIKSIQHILKSLKYEIIVIDDNSEDRTWMVVDDLRNEFDNIHCFRRMNSRGLASAIIDGFMLANGKYLMVMDGDHQHDETIINQMFLEMNNNNYNLVIASRYLDDSSNKGLNSFRLFISRMAIKLSQFITDKKSSDPMSGFFMIEKKLFLKVADKLSGKGYKILLEILSELNNDNSLKKLELPFIFKKRKYGESKLTMSISLELLDYIYFRIFGNIVPLSYLKFIGVGAIGAFIHFFILYIFFVVINFSYQTSLILAIEIALISNYFLNNFWTFKTSKLFGFNSFKGLLKFNILSGIGGLISFFISTNIYNYEINWIVASIVGAIIASLWNYNLNKIFTLKIS